MARRLNAHEANRFDFNALRLSHCRCLSWHNPCKEAVPEVQALAARVEVPFQAFVIVDPDLAEENQKGVR